MTSRLTEVREALAATLTAAEIPGLTVYSFMPDLITAPAAAVTPAPGDFLNYDTSFDSHDLTLNVNIFVQRGQPQSSSEQLDSFLDEDGPTSIVAAVKADQTLGGVVDNATVTGARNWGIYDFGKVSYLAAVVTVEILL
jgi:hypothetical protein